MGGRRVTGTPTAPTPVGTDNSTRLATTAFVQGQGYAVTASPTFTGTPTAPTPSAADNSTRLATTAWVVTLALAPLASPALTGSPTAPTPSAADNSTRLATTAYVQGQGYAVTASPAFTGTPTAPTAVATDSSTALATTAFVQAQKASPVLTGTPTAPTPGGADNSTRLATTAWVVGLALAPLASPALTGTPTAPTAGGADNSTRIATTAFVQGQGYAVTASPAFTGSPTAPTPGGADNSTRLATTGYVKGQGYATLASPAFSGTPTAPTQTVGDSSTAVATTAFVAAAVNTASPLGPLYDQIALLNLRLMITTGISTGALAQGREWELTTDEWSAGSSGQTWTTGSPAYYAGIVQIAQGAGTVIGNLTYNNGIGLAFDGVTSSLVASSAVSSGSASVSFSGYNNTVGKQWTGATVLIGFTVWAASNGAILLSGASTGYKLQGSNDGSAWVDLYQGATPTSAGAQVSVMLGLPAVAYTYHRFNVQGDGASAVVVAEVQFFTVRAMTLVSPAVTLTTAPSYADAYFLWKDDSGSAVLGTDITVDLSRDGGTTWTAATLTAITPAAGFDGTYTGVKARASVAGQPSGTALTCRIKTLNLKAQRVAAPALYAE